MSNWPVTTVAIGSDHAGFQLKEVIADHLREQGLEVTDVGCDSESSCDYPDFAGRVAELVSSKQAQRGILICGTGAGMAMVANKVPRVRAAACNEVYSAEFTRRHNDINVLTLGARIVSEKEALKIVEIFLRTGFEGPGEGGARHVRRLKKIEDLENEHLSGAGLEC